MNASVAVAQDITAIDFDGNLIGKVIPDGTAINFNNEIIGQLTADSFIVNTKGQIVGGVIPQGFAIGNDYKYLGKVAGDGTVRLASGKVAGKALPNGLVVDDNFDVIGAVLSSGLIYDDFGRAVGRLAGNGSYINFDGQNIGFVSPSGYAYRKADKETILEGRLLSNKMVVSLNGDFIGSIGPGGKVTGFEGKIIGTVHANGYVYSDTHQIIGRMVKSLYAFDNKGKYLGLVSYKGDVVKENAVVGHLRADYKIVDDQNAVIGFSVPLNSVATDLQGKYLGYLIPEGKIVKSAQRIIGTLGARGAVFDENGKMIGQIAGTGPLFDYFGRLKAEATPNGQIVSFDGAPLGVMKKDIGFDNFGSMMGSLMDSHFVTDSFQHILGLTGISSLFIDNAQKYKVSPYGYIYNEDNILVGKTLSLAPTYGEDASLFGYVNVDGSIQRSDVEGIKLDQNGFVLNSKDEIVASQIDPSYTMLKDSKATLQLSETNTFLDKNGKLTAKIVPEYMIVSSDSKNQNFVGIAGSGLNVVSNVKGEMIGYVDFMGKIYKGANIEGQINDMGLAVNSKNAFIGQVVPLRPLVNGACEDIGVTTAKGEARNSRDSILGKVLLNGQVVSEIGQIIGYAAVSGPVYDFDGKLLGTTNEHGLILNTSGQKEGCLNEDGRLYKEGSTFVGKIVNIAPVMNFDNDIIGRINLKNEFKSVSNNVEGFALPDGTVVSQDKKNLGLVFKYKFAFDKENNFIGLIDEKGQVLDEKNNVLGTVSYDGLIVSKDKAIGYALYDLYIYDDLQKAIGYLVGDGRVLDFSGNTLGKIDRGFLVNKEGALIGRGKRDYFVRNKENSVIGELLLSGEVTDKSGNTVGSVMESGEVRDAAGKLLGTARPLQYYIAREKKSADWAEKPQTGVRVEPINVGISSDEIVPSYSQKVIGVVVSPDGKYIGDLLDSGVVINPKTGDVLGYEKDGLVFDGDDNLLGMVEKKGASEKSSIFLPQDAYGISNVPSNLGPGGGFGPNERYDPVRARILAEKQKERQGNIKVGKLSSGVNPSTFTGYQDRWDGVSYKVSSWRVDMSEMILADKPIPAVLARTIMDSGVASSVPITAIVERNVYAEDGRNIVIPAGSRVMGQSAGGSSGGTTGGAVRMNITWTRLIRPDGSAFEFASAQTGDAQGRGGALGYLDEQLLKRYTLPIATSFMSSALAYIAASGKTSTSSDGSTVSDARAAASEQARENFLNQMNFIFDDLVQRKSEIEAVTYVPAGTRLIIYPKVDLWLRTVERDEADSSQDMEKPETLIDDRRTSGGSAQPSASRSGGSSSSSQIVYDGDDDIEPSSTTLLDDSASQKARKRRKNAAGATPPPPSTSATATTNTSENSAGSLF